MPAGKFLLRVVLLPLLLLGNLLCELWLMAMQAVAPKQEPDREQPRRKGKGGKKEK